MSNSLDKHLSTHPDAALAECDRTCSICGFFVCLFLFCLLVDISVEKKSTAALQNPSCVCTRGSGTLNLSTVIIGEPCCKQTKRKKEGKKDRQKEEWKKDRQKHVAGF